MSCRLGINSLTTNRISFPSLFEEIGDNDVKDEQVYLPPFPT